MQDIEPGYENDGRSGGVACAVCLQVLEFPEILPALGHNEEPCAALAPTCSADGHSEGVICTRCGKIISGMEPLSRLPHSEIVVEEAVPATHITTGFTESRYCTTCNSFTSERVEIPTVDVPVISLPESLLKIEKSAFSGSTFQCVAICDGCLRIEAEAFANNPNLLFVEIPASIVEIDETAFESCNPEMIIISSPGSAAYAYAQKHGICCIIK